MSLENGSYTEPVREEIWAVEWSGVSRREVVARHGGKVFLTNGTLIDERDAFSSKSGALGEASKRKMRDGLVQMNEANRLATEAEKAANEDHDLALTGKGDHAFE